jgi:hypothetical protein
MSLLSLRQGVCWHTWGAICQIALQLENLVSKGQWNSMAGETC